jgi:SHS2 domain-containing protein
MPQGFQEIEHTADRAFRVRGVDLKELFVNAARAMFAMQGGRGRGRATVMREVSVEGVDRETLLVNWLNELLYLQEVHKESYGRFEILEISDTRLGARVHGRPGSNREKLIKAVTFHGLEVKKDRGGWHATVVVDV